MMKTHWTTLFLLSLACGCASYGWSNQGKTGDRLKVNTVQSPPHLGMDDALLTRIFVEELGAQGVPSIWADGSDAVFCDVSIWDDRGFGTQYSVRAEAKCRNSQWSVSRNSITQATLALDANEPKIRAIREQAAIDVLRKIAGGIGQRESK